MKKIFFISCCLVVTMIANATINLKPQLFIQGYYIGSQYMTDVYVNQDCEGAVSGKTCNITVELHASSSPYAVVTNGVDNSVNLTTDGNAYSCSFAISPDNSTSYYIVIKSLNGLELWSSTPVTFPSSSTVTYDFRTSSSQAIWYGPGFPLPQIEVETGVWAMYSGDIVTDGSVDSYDQYQLDLDVENFEFGCAARSDLNGDGNVDLLDASILDDNITNYSPLITQGY